MKHVLPALVAVVFTLTACKTTADRFDLYAPDRPQGPATERTRGMTLAGRYNHKSTTYTYPVTAVAPLPPPPENGPVAPPPPPVPGAESAVPESNVAAPAVTPLPEAMPATPPAAAPPAASPATGADQPAIPGLNNAPATPAPAPGASPAPAIPGLSQ